MKNLVRSVVLLIFLSACGGNEELPEGIIPDSVMSHLLVRFSLIDASYTVSLTDPSSVRFKPELFYEAELKERGYTREEFNESIHFYTRNTKRLLSIYEEAFEELSKEQAESAR